MFLFSTALNAVFLGIIGEYVARIYRNTLSDPLTVIEQAMPPSFVHDDPDWGQPEIQPKIKISG